jgi:hypothetical protein
VPAGRLLKDKLPDIANEPVIVVDPVIFTALPDILLNRKLKFSSP